MRTAKEGRREHRGLHNVVVGVEVKVVVVANSKRISYRTTGKTTTTTTNASNKP